MGVIWRRSSEKHGIAHEDALNAMLFAVARLDEFDDPRLPGHNAPILFLGPARDRAALLEVMVEILDSGDVSIFHVMKARKKIIELVAEMRRQ